MGAGFILGGFCPGTSFCAASIGKIDAMFFIVGMFLGIFIFTEGYPLWEGFYMSKFMGIPTLSQVLGLKDGIVVLGVIIVAFGMFWVGEWAESKFPREEY
jgi:hypothetical protein